MSTHHIFVLFISILFPVFIVAQDADEVCKGSFRQVVLGESIGTTGLNVADIDNDGINEMILSAGDETFEDGRFWYVLKYTGTEKMFEQVWVSSYYSDRIMHMSVMDIDDNGIYEVVLGLQSGRAEIYSTEDMSLISRFVVDNTNTGYYNEGITTALKADADNDGTPELVLLSMDTTYIYSACLPAVPGLAPFLEYMIPNGSQYLVCGNVDDEPLVELVYTNGSVIRLSGGSHQEIWDFDNSPYSYGGPVGITDMDGDGDNEIYSVGYNKIDVLDVETESVLFDIEVEVDYHAFLMSDIDGDGKNEILAGERDGGEVFFYRPTGTLIWSKFYGHGGLNCINVANVDDEPNKEIIWADAHGTTGEDYLYTFDLDTQIQEWQSESVNGPFLRVRVFDVDNDGIEELITVSAATHDYYDEGQVSIWDPYTHDLEWKSPDTLFDYTTHFADFTIYDVDNDGVPEIILPSRKSYDAIIYVLDPIAHVIEKEFSYDLPESFDCIDIGDPDNDGKPEYVLGSSTAVVVIDPQTGAIERLINPKPYYDFGHQRIMVENIDQDLVEEIIFMSDSLYIFDGNSHIALNVGEYDEITSFDLYDIDGDGVKEIIHGTLDGKIGMAESPDYRVAWFPVQMAKRVGGLRVYDITGDSDPELIFASSGRIWFSTFDGHMEFTNVVTQDEEYEYWHVHENIEISDFDHNGEKEVFVGGSFQVTELGTHCYECVTFIATTNTTGVTCLPGNDGSISVNLVGGIEPYSFEWSNGSTDPQITGLPAGTYTVTSKDHVGCTENNTVTLAEPVFETRIDENYITGCTEEHAAVLTPIVVQGSFPVTYLWNTGSTDSTLTTLDAGSYSVMVTDKFNCSDTLFTEVVKDTFAVDTVVQPIACYEDPASIQIFPVGTEPFSYTWSNGTSSNPAYFSKGGNYSVTVTGGLGCTWQHNFTIESCDGCKVYPVPAINELTIELGSNHLNKYSAQLELWNLRGKKITSAQITTKLSTLYISHLPEGFYLLQVTINGKANQFKIEKVH